MTKQVVVVGGGVIGLCAAHYCMKRGLGVVVVERNSLERNGCSFGNAGMIVPSHFTPLAAPGMVTAGLKWMADPESPFYVQPRFSWELLRWGYRFWRSCTKRHVERSAPLLRDLNMASRACYEALAEETSNDFGLVRRGLLMLYKTARGFDEESHAAERAVRLGVPAEILDARAAAALDPGARMDVVGAVHYPRDAHLAPGRFMAGLQRRLAAAGCRFLWDRETTGFEKRGRTVVGVRTRDELIEADAFVLAGGVWSSGVAKSLGLSLPMQAGKGYSLTLPEPRQRPELCSILTEARVAATPIG
ncbi:MAG: FAD-dependent oxidoreductase, partial [Planctomycetia bacterium]